MSETITGQQACELIAEYLNATQPRAEPWTWAGVWNISPTGELWPVHVLYWEARAWHDGSKENHE